jgi:hypothetical protein
MPEALAVPLVSEYAPSDKWRLTWCADPTFSTAFRVPFADRMGELNCVYLGAVGMDAPEERRFYACVHSGDERAAFDAFYTTALADVPPGPDWLHDVAWTHYDYLTDGGRGWIKDVDTLAEAVPSANRHQILLCLHGWYDWLGSYSYDHQSRSLLESWDAHIQIETTPQLRYGPESFQKVPLNQDKVRELLRYARERGFRTALYFLDGLTADSADLGRLYSPDQALRCGGWEATRSHAFVQNPLHPAVRERLHGYLDALLETWGSECDAMVWDETHYINAGELGPAVCPGYADRAMLTLVGDLAAQAHAYRPDMALLGSDNIGRTPALVSKPPYSIVADGTFQDSSNLPGAWRYGLFPNLRNVLWSCNWAPQRTFDLTAFGVRQFDTTVSTSNGYIENRGPSDLSAEELRAHLDLFHDRRHHQTRLRWLEQSESSELPLAGEDLQS